MELPRRIFIALGDPSDVSSVASGDVRQQDLNQAVREREEAKQRVKQLEENLKNQEEILKKHQKRNQNETRLGVVLLLILISVFLFVIWLCFRSPPPAPAPAPAAPAPAESSAPQAPTPRLHRDCKHKCGPPHHWEYEDFECWRHRSMRGSCFN